MQHCTITRRARSPKTTIESSLHFQFARLTSSLEAPIARVQRNASAAEGAAQANPKAVVTATATSRMRRPQLCLDGKSGHL